MQHAVLLRWVVLFGVVIAGFVGTVLTLNLTLYSASGFVGAYLADLQRHDVQGAISATGVGVQQPGSRALLTPEALASLEHIAPVSDVDAGDGQHRVTYTYSVGGHTGRSTFAVERDGARFGLFSAWRFVSSPISTLVVTPEHDEDFEANGVDLASSAPGRAEDYLVLTPGYFALAHHSAYLTARPTGALVSRAESTVRAQVDVEASPAFVKEVQKQLDAYLKKCATQKVLLPTGCPMGKQIDDRIQDEPSWTMVSYPTVSIVPGSPVGRWQMPKTTAVAHLKVTVKSIFDGRVSIFDQDVPFSVGYAITIHPDGTLSIDQNAT